MFDSLDEMEEWANEEYKKRYSEHAEEERRAIEESGDYTEEDIEEEFKDNLDGISEKKSKMKFWRNFMRNSESCLRKTKR